MTISVDISGRLYDYTDEEKAAEAVAQFQEANALDDEVIITLWANANDPRRVQLEKAIFEAVDANGSAKRAKEEVPTDVVLGIVENHDC